jgi:hypothetical protein
MSTELRNRREVRHDDKHRFDRTGHPVGDEIAVRIMECVDCGEEILVITGIIGKREYHFPLFYESIPSLVEYLMEVYESTEEIPDDE